jgi:hypothetical protein
VLVGGGTPAAAPPPASVAPADRCFTATITPTTIPMPTTPGTAIITIVCHASPSATFLSLDDSEAEGREVVRSAVADIDRVAVIDDDRVSVVDGEIVLLRVAVSIDRVTVIVWVRYKLKADHEGDMRLRDAVPDDDSDQVTLVLLERSDDCETDSVGDDVSVGPEVDSCALALSDTDGESNNVRDADTITLLENEIDKDDVRDCVSVPLVVTDKEYVGDCDAVPLAEVEGDNVSEGDNVRVPVNVPVAENEDDDVHDSDGVPLLVNEGDNDSVCDANEESDIDSDPVLLLVIDRTSEDVRVRGNVSLAVIEDDHVRDFDTDLLLESESEFDCVHDADFVASVESVSE